MIEQFVAQSVGEWRSMRSGHSLAFKQFEEVVSSIQIKPIDLDNALITETIQQSNFPGSLPTSPFSIEWAAESDWLDDNKEEKMSGKSIFIPINVVNNKGIILRSIGYSEAISTISEFSFLSDGTLTLKTDYESTTADERIWFLSKSVRCRSSVIKNKQSNGILQTSFASELKLK